MLSAIKANRVVKIRDGLESGEFFVFNQNKNKIYPLHYAVSLNRLSIVALLVEFGADLKEKNHLSQTPLHMAVKNENIKCVRLLLSLGADPNEIIRGKPFRIIKSEPLFHVVCATENFEIVKAFVESGVNINIKDHYNNLLFFCVYCNSGRVEFPLDILIYLIENGLDIKNEESYKSIERFPLYLMLRSIDIEAAKVMIDRGVNINFVDYYGNSLVTIPWNYESKFESIKFLCENISDSSIQNSRGYTLLHNITYVNENYNLILFIL